MQRYRAHLGNLLAIASFAMMLSVQMLHSPLHHCQDSVCSLGAERSHAGHELTSHGHTHHHHGCSHNEDLAANHSHEPVQNESPTDDCQLCEFLSLAVSIVQLPVMLEGEQTFALLNEESVTLHAAAVLNGPHVRGPPAFAFA